MSHLSTVYSKDLGCQIGVPIIKDHYFPLPCSKYITIHNDKKVPAKEYGYFDITLRLLKPILAKHEIKVIQVGAHGETNINGVDYHIPTNSIKQLCNILKNSLAHVGCDSLPVHISSIYDKPIVALYAHTYAKTCNPIWNKTSPAFLLESHRNGNKPNFCLSEEEQTINMIMPHEVANCVLKSLNINEEVSESTTFIGKRFKGPITDIIPSEMPQNLNKDCFYNIRMDVAHNEVVLNEILKILPCEVTTHKAFDPQILNNKNNIRSINYITSDFNESFVRAVKTFGINSILLCNKKESLASERFKLFDFMISELDVEEQCKTNEAKLKFLPPNFKVDSSRKVICGEQVFNTLSDYLANKGADISKQRTAFLLDIDWFRIYNNA
jgi:hypothetical protein